MTNVLNWLTVLVFAASLVLRNPTLFLLGLLLALLAGVTALWERYALAGVSYTRRFGTARLFVGEETEVSIEIINAKPLPLAWLKAEDEFPAEIALLRGRLHYSHKPNRRMLVNLLTLRFYERVRKHYRLRFDHRGVMEFGPCRLSSGDMFGFRTQTQGLAQVERITVYPKVVPVTALGLPEAHPLGDVRTPRRVMEDPLQLMGVRAYAPGDSPRFVHWKATARRGQLQSKVFEPSASQVTAIFLDLQTVADYPGIIPDYLEFAIIAAASVARHILDGREAVGMYVNGSRRNDVGLIRLLPSRRPDQWTEILEALAWLNGLSSARLPAFLRAETTSLPFGAAVVAISAIASDDLTAALLDLRSAGHPIALLAIGEEAPRGVPEGIDLHWLGGHETYARLADFTVDGDGARQFGSASPTGAV